MRGKVFAVVAACLLVAVVVLLRGHTRPPDPPARVLPPLDPTRATSLSLTLPPSVTLPPSLLPAVAVRTTATGQWHTVPATPGASTVDTPAGVVPALAQGWELSTEPGPFTARHGEVRIVLDTAANDVEQCGGHVYWSSEGKLARWTPGAPNVDELDLPGTFAGHRCVYGILNVTTDDTISDTTGQGGPRLWFLGAP